MCITVATTVSVPRFVVRQGDGVMPPIKEDGMSGLASAAAAHVAALDYRGGEGGTVHI